MLAPGNGMYIDTSLLMMRRDISNYIANRPVV